MGCKQAIILRLATTRGGHKPSLEKAKVSTSSNFNACNKRTIYLPQKLKYDFHDQLNSPSKTHTMSCNCCLLYGLRGPLLVGGYTINRQMEQGSNFLI